MEHGMPPLTHPSDLYQLAHPAPWLPLVPADAVLGDRRHPQAVLINPGTPVVVLQHALTSALVAVVGGAHDGRCGWVPATWLRPTR